MQYLAVSNYLKNISMKISELKNILRESKSVNFKLADGTSVPAHFHLTEVGMLIKHFIDCGGKERIERKVSMQLWSADDLDHRLKPQKFLDIINMGEEKLGISNLEIEVEYQNDTIGKYMLSHDGSSFILNNKNTACLASDVCGPPANQKASLTEMVADSNGCAPGGGCC